MNGNVNIYFGNVISIKDTDFKCRAKIKINGLTESFTDEKLPYYFPFYGINYLPQIDDVVPVIIFDDNLASGFYGKKIDIKSKKYLGTDYENYLEIFKREIKNSNGLTDNVELTYTPSKGIEFLNGNSLINIENDKISLFCASNGITITEKEIKIGSNAEQYALKGDDVIETLSKISSLITNMAGQLSTASTSMTQLISGCSTPFTASLIPGLTQLGISMTTLATNSASLGATISGNFLQSNKVKIE